MSQEKPDQIQASVAAALSRLRGDLGPTGAAAPRIDEPGSAGDRPRPANDVRGDPFFRSIQSPPPGTGMARGPIPMTPFPRMQTPEEPQQQEPDAAQETEALQDEDAGLAPEASGTIEIPEMPEREETPEPVSMPEPPALSTEASAVPPAPQPESQSETALTAAAAAAAVNPLARMMRGTAQPGSAAPAQRDLLADLPPPPISEPLIADTESGATHRKRRNRRLLAAAAAIIVIALGAWLWTGGKPSTEVPVITADATPEKVKPAAGEEGGLQVQNQDVQVLDPSTQTQTETVMPEPEQPITPPAAGQMPTGEAPTVVENTDSNAAPAAQAPDVAPSLGVPLAETPLPAMEDTGTTETAPAAPAAEAPQQTQTAEAPAASEPTPAPTQDNTAEATPTPAPAVTPQPAPEPTAQQEQPAVQPEQPAAQEAPTQEAAVTPTAPAGNTRVQLAAGKSEATVQKEWAALQKAHPDLLGSLSLHIERVDKGASGIFYRLQAGPLADKNAAKQLCASLKQKGQDCLVVAK